MNEILVTPEHRTGDNYTHPTLGEGKLVLVGTEARIKNGLGDTMFVTAIFEAAEPPVIFPDSSAAVHCANRLRLTYPKARNAIRQIGGKSCHVVLLAGEMTAKTFDL